VPTAPQPLVPQMRVPFSRRLKAARSGPGSAIAAQHLACAFAAERLASEAASQNKSQHPSIATAAHHLGTSMASHHIAEAMASQTHAAGVVAPANVNSPQREALSPAELSVAIRGLRSRSPCPDKSPEGMSSTRHLLCEACDGALDHDVVEGRVRFCDGCQKPVHYTQCHYSWVPVPDHHFCCSACIVARNQLFDPEDAFPLIPCPTVAAKARAAEAAAVRAEADAVAISAEADLLDLHASSPLKGDVAFVSELEEMQREMEALAVLRMELVSLRQGLGIVGDNETALSNDASASPAPGHVPETSDATCYTILCRLIVRCWNCVSCASIRNAPRKTRIGRAYRKVEVSERRRSG